MEATPRTTVLMPVYNGMSFLREALESVLQQTDRNFELLIIDDASTDGSAELITSYQDPRIRFVLNERNIGQACTLNKGLELARGTYIARLDQDDVCLPTRLQQQCSYMEEHPSIVITCTWEHTIDDKGRRVCSWRGCIQNRGAFLGTTLLGKCAVWHPSVMFRRHEIRTLGGYDPSFSPADDYELWMRIACAGFEAGIVPEYLVSQRVHSHRQSIQRLDHQIQQVRRAHNSFIRQILSTENAEAVAALVRADGSFWSQSLSVVTAKKAILSVRSLLSQLQRLFNLSDDEVRVASRLVFSRVGLGARLAHFFSRMPPSIFMCLYYILSPFQIMFIRKSASLIFRIVHELRYPWRLVRAGFRLGT